MMDINEIILQKEPYIVDIPVKIYERIQLSGYIRTSEDENKDAAIIVFDLGDIDIENNMLKAQGLVKSKIGIFKYLPVGKDFQIWNANIFIPEKIDTLKVKFLTWKNKNDIIISEEMAIVKDYAYSSLYREFLKSKKNYQ